MRRNFVIALLLFLSLAPITTGESDEDEDDRVSKSTHYKKVQTAGAKKFENKHKWKFKQNARIVPNAPSRPARRVPNPPVGLQLARPAAPHAPIRQRARSDPQHAPNRQRAQSVVQQAPIRQQARAAPNAPNQQARPLPDVANLQARPKPKAPNGQARNTANAMATMEMGAHGVGAAQSIQELVKGGQNDAQMAVSILSGLAGVTAMAGVVFPPAAVLACRISDRC